MIEHSGRTRNIQYFRNKVPGITGLRDTSILVFMHLGDHSLWDIDMLGFKVLHHLDLVHVIHLIH